MLPAFRTLLLSASLVLPAYAPAAAQTPPVPERTTLQNGDFSVTYPVRGVRREWWMIGDPDKADVAFDETVRHAGKPSMRVAGWSHLKGFGQQIDARPYRGKTLELKAHVRTADENGLVASLWLRTDAEGKPLINVNMGASSITGTNDWQSYAIRIWVQPSAEVINAGAFTTGSGTAWFAGFTLEEAAAPPVATGSAEIADLDAAIGIMREHYVHAGSVDWSALHARARAVFRSGAGAGDLHRTLSLLFQGMGERHALTIAPSIVDGRKTIDGANDGSGPLADLLPGGIARVRVPGLLTFDEQAADRYAARLAAEIERVAAHATCGWIVDLGRNGGGTMWPMLAGLAALLPDAPLGHFRSAGKLTAWRIGDAGAFNGDDLQQASAPSGRRASRAAAPLAVLISGETASSGEATALAFKSRPATRFFGSRTAGLTTVNTGFELRDGGLLMLPTGVMLDARMAAYPDGIAPDEARTGDADALSAASTWLARTCAPAPR